MIVNIFCCYFSNFNFSNTDPLSHWNTFGYLNTAPFLYIASNTNATTLSWFQELLLSCILMQHQHLLICTCICFLQRHCDANKTDQTDAIHEFLSPCNAGVSFPKGVVHKIAKVLVLLTMTRHPFLV